MSRTLSANTLRELMAQNSAEVLLVLLTLTHDAMPTPIRVVDNNENVTSRGDTYHAFPFSLALPEDETDRLPVATLTLSNVDRRLVDEVRTLSGPMTATVEIIAASSPDTVEIGPMTFDVVAVEYTKETMTATLAYEPILSEPFPYRTFDPQHFPQIFS